MRRLRCAIYTRKSSEEGLDQDFNSLDAQREACTSYIRSQKGEGWTALPTLYDDGGWSGGNMERPALTKLLTDIEAGRIDIVVVYKVDRLTRSLSDFARIVDIFDRGNVSFVSVTQAFNTTSSMGRLTLNVLLSFAQFEREVTGERIRDKIAASKARGMWMGGVPPLGYVADDRTLRIEPEEAELVRSIFERYLVSVSINRLTIELAAEGVRTPRRLLKSGRIIGGAVLSRGALAYLLKNRLYRGEIVHKDKVYPGLHQAIITDEMFDAVQALLAGSREPNKASANALTRDKAPLAGLIFDGSGERMTPTHARGRSNKVYRYYTSLSLQQGKAREPGRLQRVPGEAIETLILERLRIWSGRPLAQWSELLPHLVRIDVHGNTIVLRIEPPEPQHWQERIAPDDAVAPAQGGQLLVTVLTRLRTRTGRSSVMLGERQPRARPDRAMIAALRGAHRALAEHGVDHLSRKPDIARARGVANPHLRRQVQLAFLAPDIQNAILTGRQPTSLTLAQLLTDEFPCGWDEQRARLGFPC